MKKIIVLMCFILLMQGCSVKSETTRTCRLTNNQVTSELVFYAEGDNVLKSIETMHMDLQELGIEEDADKDTVVSNMLVTFGGVEGMNVESSWSDNDLEVLLTIDYAVIDKNILVAMGMMDEADVEAKTISLKSSVDGVSNSGYICD